MSAQKDRFAPAALGIFAAALAVRIAHVWQMRATPFFSVLMGDSRGYDEWARRIAGGEWLGHDVFYQAPLYPYLLGVIYATAGRHLLLVRIIQAIIGSASCVLLGMAAARLFSRRAGLVAGMMLALYAPAVFFDGLLQKSVLDVFLVCLALWLIAEISVRLKADPTSDRLKADPTEISVRLKADPTSDRRSDRGRSERGRSDRGRSDRGRSERGVRLQPDRLRLVLLGVTMGALALTRENALVLIVVLFGWTLLPIRESRIPSPESRLTRAGAFLAGLAIVLAPVAARNAYVGGGFYITTSQAGPNFYIGNNPKADGTYQSLRFGRGAPEYERQDATELAELALGRTLTPSEVSSYWIDKAIDFITSQPGAWLRLMARKVALLCNATEMLDTESQEAHAEYSLPLRVLGVVGHFGVLVPLAVLGLIRTWPMRRRIRILYALTGAYAASVIVFYVFARYRYPLVPMLMPFAAAGVVEAATIFTTKRTTMGRTEANGRYGNVRGSAFRGNALWTATAVTAAAVFGNWPMLSAATMRAVTETNLGVALQTGQRLDEAIAHYRRAIALSPDYAAAYNNLGSALRASGSRNDAVAAYQRAIELRPDFAGAHYNMANVLMDEGNASAAIEQFTRALDSEPGSADVHNNLGIALAGVGRLDEAIAEFRRAIQLDPASSKAYRNLGDALSTSGAHREGLDNLRQAVRLAPADAAIRYDLASALLEAGLLDEAIREFRETLRVKPTFIEAHNNLGIALGSSGRLDDAIQEFRAALSIDPHFADARRNLEMAVDATKKR